MSSNQTSPQDSHATHLMCQELKKKHDDCFYKWYNQKFLNQSKEQIPCDSEWKLYSECLKQKLDILQLTDKVKPPSSSR